MQANAWLNRMSAGALFPLVLWWRSVFSSPLIDFLKLEWTSEQVKHFMVEFDSRYQLEKHQLCWGFIWKFSWHGYFCFPLISADLPPTTRQDLFSYSTQSILSSHVSPRLSRSLSLSLCLTDCSETCSPFYGHLHQLATHSAWLYSTAVWPWMVRSRFKGKPLWKFTAARKT